MPAVSKCNDHHHLSPAIFNLGSYNQLEMLKHIVMKKLLLALLVLSSHLATLAQESNTEVKHQGFYLSMATGPAWGNISWKTNGLENNVKGDAFGLICKLEAPYIPTCFCTLHFKARHSLVSN
jgi:hypothetical protein